MIDARRVILLVGCPRSGTTLLRRMLTRHPELEVHPEEPQFIRQLYRRCGGYVRQLDAALDYIASHPYSEVSREKLSDELGSRRTATLEEIFEAYFRCWTGKGRSRRRLVLKDPRLLFHLEGLDELLGWPTVVNVIRDPRACVASLRLRWPVFTVEYGARMWREAIRGARRWARRRASRYVETYYRDLVRTPETELRAICRRLRLPFVDDMLTLEPYDETVSAESGQTVRFEGPDPKRIGIWEERLSPAELRVVEHYCREEMRPLGFDPMTSPDVSARFAVDLGWRAFKGRAAEVRVRARRLRRIALWRTGLGKLETRGL